MALVKLVKGGSRFIQARAFHQATLSKSGPELDSTPEQFLLEHADNLTSGMVVTFIRKQTDPQLAYRLFSLAGSRTGYKHDATAYSSILHCLCRSKQFDLIPTIFGDMIAQNCHVGAPTWTFVLKSMGAAGMTKATLTLFRKLVSLGFEPSYHAYNAVICTLVQAGEIGKAMQLLAEMEDAGVYIDSMVVGMVTHALCKAGKVSEAVKLVESVVVKMPGSVDTLSVHGIVGHLCQAGRPYDALKLVENMKAFAVFPDVVTYNKLMAGFCGLGQVDEALRLLDKMSEDSVSPKPVTLSTLLNGLCKQRRFDEALLLFRKMGSTIEEDSNTYNILVHSLCSQMRIKEVWDLASEMVRKGGTFTVHTYTAIVRGFFRLGKEEKAFETLHEMKKMGINGDPKLYNEFIVWLCGKGKVDNALQLLAEMVKSGCFPDEHNVCAIIAGLCKVNRVVDALEFAYEMMKNDWVRNAVVFNPILQVLCASGDKEQALKLLDVLLDKGVTPSRSTYSAMLKGLCIAKRFDDVRKLLAEMRKNGFEPDLSTYTTLINTNAHHISGTVDLFTPLIGSNIQLSTKRYASLLDGLLISGEVECALKVFEDIQRGGCKMSASLFNVLIDGLCKNNRVHEAREYFLKMRDGGCPPDHITYTVLMHGFRSAGQFDVLDLLYREMKADGCKADDVTFTALLMGFAQGERFKELYDTLDDMKVKGRPPTELTLRLLFQHLRYKDTKRVSKYIKEVFGIDYGMELSETAQSIKNEEEDTMRRGATRLDVTRREEGETQNFLGFEKVASYSSKTSSDGLEGQALKAPKSKKSVRAKSITRPIVSVKKSTKDASSRLSSCRTSSINEGKTERSWECKGSAKLEVSKGTSSSVKNGSSKAFRERKHRQGRREDHTQQVIDKFGQKNTKAPQSLNRSDVDGKAHEDTKGSKFAVKEGSVKLVQTSKAGEKQKTKQRKLVKEFL